MWPAAGARHKGLRFAHGQVDVSQRLTLPL